MKDIVEEAISKGTGGIIMTVAEQLIEKGERKGIEKGIEKGELIGSIRTAQLMKGIPISDKEQLEKLSIEELEEMLKNLTEK